MRIVIVGGYNKADFLIDSLLKKNHKLVVVNEDKDYSEYLSMKYDISVVCGDPCKQYLLEEAEIDDFDILISLMEKDQDNFAICQTAKKIYNIKKVVCIVTDPKNVDIFKKLGLDTVISATYSISKLIEQASTIESLMNTLALENEKIIMSEILIDKNYLSVGKKLAEIVFPENAIISCILRNNSMIVPNGNTVIEFGDKLFIISTPENQKEALNSITKDNLV
ncbi:TrkA family potassium uptake protein [uncultured Fusobacterium sp.]|jgi:trk system potassium uptake protein TrkA|uniref:potassium channel family protein n=1 Tax=uncultured Fusobacterium sp. TaxID=159267 RepID=UPI0015A5DDF0|nr:TrkA family potassium uptake protein [uncultured Fusobacterium sp.]